MLAPPQARRSGPGEGGDQEGAVDMDKNASYGGEVERNVSRDSDFLLCGQLLKTPPLVSAGTLCQASESKGQRRRVATGIGATALRSGPNDVRPIAYCRASLKARRRGVTAVAVRRRSTVSGSGFLPLRDRLGRVTVLPQLKVDRLWSVVDGTAGFDLKPSLTIPMRNDSSMTGG